MQVAFALPVRSRAMLSTYAHRDLRQGIARVASVDTAVALGYQWLRTLTLIYCAHGHVARDMFDSAPERVSRIHIDKATAYETLCLPKKRRVRSKLT
jgi:hypothetical protein